MKTQTNYERYQQQFKAKAYLPAVVVHFLDNMANIPSPVIRKKLTYEFDTLKHNGGKPILERSKLYPYTNLSKAQERLNILLNITFPKNLKQEDFAKNLLAIKSKIEAHKGFSKDLLNAFLHEQESFYQEQAEVSTSFSFMCYFIAYFAFLPFFVHTREQITQQYDDEAWTHGHCPYCAGPPLLSYLKGKEGRRINACSVCLGFYRVPRIQCPYCLEKKQDKFRIFTADTDADFQVCVCNSCKNYIKIHDYKEYEKFNPHPLLDDFKSITLDVIAENNKYTKAVLSLWLI